MDRTSAQRTKQRVTKRQSGPSAAGWRNGLPEAFIVGQWVRWLVDGGGGHCTLMCGMPGVRL
jgi:hypothetical protein